MAVIYIIFPILALLVVVFQATVLSALVLYKINIEVSLMLTVYAGLRLDVIRGGVFSLILGFFMDCMVGTVTCFFVFLYALIFFISMLISSRVYIDRAFFVGTFTALCAFIEGVMIILFYQFIYEIDIYDQLWMVYIPQALLIGLLNPLFFKVLDRLEVLLEWQKR
jgi:rod shape-determining protein MreD